MSREVGERMSPELKELHDLRAFKAYVHGRLDAAGVPADPEPEQNAAHGCRIEGRLNYVLARLDTQTVTLERMRGALERLGRGEWAAEGPGCGFHDTPKERHAKDCPTAIARDALSTPVSAGEALLRLAREMAQDFPDPHTNRAIELREKIFAAYRAELAERGGK